MPIMRQDQALRGCTCHFEQRDKSSRGRLPAAAFPWPPLQRCMVDRDSPYRSKWDDSAAFPWAKNCRLRPPKKGGRDHNSCRSPHWSKNWPGTVHPPISFQPAATQIRKPAVRLTLQQTPSTAISEQQSSLPPAP